MTGSIAIQEDRRSGQTPPLGKLEKAAAVMAGKVQFSPEEDSNGLDHLYCILKIGPNLSVIYSRGIFVQLVTKESNFTQTGRYLLPQRHQDAKQTDQITG
jgi:hypothetical protein